MSKLTLATHPFLLGFDELERLVERTIKSGNEGYPPYNIEQTAESSFRITLALAGFHLDNLSIQIEDRQLVIRGKQQDDTEGRVFLHRGIAARQFQRAFVLAEGVEVVGLTSPGNAAFVSSLGCYDQVLGYDGLAGLDSATESAVVDMAGNGSVLADVHNHFGDALKYSCLVGATHWDARQGAQNLPGPAPQLFFAPSRVAQRTKDWGPGGLQERFQGAWTEFLTRAEGWINVSREQGEAAIEQRYLEQLGGQVSPQLGLILSVG